MKKWNSSWVVAFRVSDDTYPTGRYKIDESYLQKKFDDFRFPAISLGTPEEERAAIKAATDRYFAEMEEERMAIIDRMNLVYKTMRFIPSEALDNGWMKRVLQYLKTQHEFDDDNATNLLKEIRHLDNGDE